MSGKYAAEKVSSKISDAIMSAAEKDFSGFKGYIDSAMEDKFVEVLGMVTREKERTVFEPK